MLMLTSLSRDQGSGTFTPENRKTAIVKTLYSLSKQNYIHNYSNKLGQKVSGKTVWI